MSCIDIWRMTVTAVNSIPILGMLCTDSRYRLLHALTFPMYLFAVHFQLSDLRPTCMLVRLVKLSRRISFIIIFSWHVEQVFDENDNPRMMDIEGFIRSVPIPGSCRKDVSWIFG